ncbi:hypothetical protein G647_00965 [Cladophialophora carrionii CBS 160.54]|uniref:Uncharacterized protein n=1 Tax=Cladophialophora carrionii CBS 160.54 TaxID=1279043 RepID=V9DNR1_9EURO|nr:uncharacterized protein G647_00965 [Cladophialophora carrionii CBS 160.54]ETI28515.1 hypothetical protein G647_00965 [Cladophialophora carrionii CBS 160.54]
MGTQSDSHFDIRQGLHCRSHADISARQPSAHASPIRQRQTRTSTVLPTPRSK